MSVPKNRNWAQRKETARSRQTATPNREDLVAPAQQVELVRLQRAMADPAAVEGAG